MKKEVSLLPLLELEGELIALLETNPYQDEFYTKLDFYKAALGKLSDAYLSDDQFWRAATREKVSSLLYQARLYKQFIGLFLSKQSLRARAKVDNHRIAWENYQFLQDFLSQHNHFLSPKIALLDAMVQINRGLEFDYLRRLIFSSFEGVEKEENYLPVLEEMRNLYQKTIYTIEKLDGEVGLKENDLYYCYQWQDFLAALIPNNDFFSDFYRNYWHWGFSFYQYQLAENQQFIGEEKELLPIVKHIAKLHDILHNCSAIPYQPIRVEGINLGDFLGLDERYLSKYIGQSDAFGKILKTDKADGGLLRILFNQPYGATYSEIDFLSQKSHNKANCRAEFLSYFCREGLGLDLTRSDGRQTMRFYQITTAHSSYFDAGREWWGEYFYAIYQPLRKTIAFVLASSSD